MSKYVKKEGVYYTAIHCTKCHSVCIVEREHKNSRNQRGGFIRPMPLWIILLGMLSDIPDHIQKQIKLLKRRVNPGNLNNWETPVSCVHIEGICEKCLKDEKSALFDENNAIDNYRAVIKNLRDLVKRIYFQKERELIKTLTWKYFYENDKDSFKRFCIEKHGKNIDEKIMLAEEYIKKTNIIEHLKSMVLENESVAYLKSRAAKLREEAKALAKENPRGMNRYSEVKPLWFLNERIIKTKKCPLFPNETISKHKMYALEQKYNTNRLLKKYRDEELFSRIRQSVDRTIKHIAQKIIYTDWKEEE